METQMSYYNLEVGIEQAPLYHSLYIFIDSKLSCGMWEHSLCYTSEFVNQRNATGMLLPLIRGYLWAGAVQHSWRCLWLSAGWPNHTGQQTFSPVIILRVQAPRLRHLKEKIHIPEAEHKIFIWRGRGLINFCYKCLQLKVVINNLPKAIFQFALIVLYYTLYFQETIIMIRGHGISSCLMNDYPV